MVEIGLDDEHAPLHTGSSALVRWKAVLGERVIELRPGPPRNPEVPSGGMIDVAQEQVEVDEVLAVLDPETRGHLGSMVRRLDATLRDDADETRDLIRDAGPAVGALGEVLKAVGEDGHAIRNLVTDLGKMIGPLAERDSDLTRVVDGLTSATQEIAPHQQALSDALVQLPPTLDSAKSTLDRVPSTVGETVPLLDDLRPVSEDLTSLSKNLSPFLAELRPAVAELRPTLSSASTLLHHTPALLDSAHSVFPDLNHLVDALNPAVDFLRPYTPDLAGWLSNWGSAYAYYDSQSHYAGAVVRAGVSSLDENPGLPLTLDIDPTPAPGKASGEPWTDANGSGMR